MDDLLTRRVKIGVQYIGTKYCGWQSQKNAVSVQELVEKALGGVLGHEVRLTASGRTDECTQDGRLRISIPTLK